MTRSKKESDSATGFSHLDKDGNANMVDVGEKAVSQRLARAKARVKMSEPCFKMLREGSIEKGDVLATARIAGIQGAKQTANLIPLCHPLMLSQVKVDFDFDDLDHSVLVLTQCKLAGQTGVEMEALTAASVAALTIYDMCKAIDKGMQIDGLALLEKHGGKSGVWKRDTKGSESGD